MVKIHGHGQPKLNGHPKYQSVTILIFKEITYKMKLHNVKWREWQTQMSGPVNLIDIQTVEYGEIYLLFDKSHS